MSWRKWKKRLLRRQREIWPAVSIKPKKSWEMPICISRNSSSAVLSILTPSIKLIKWFTISNLTPFCWTSLTSSVTSESRYSKRYQRCRSLSQSPTWVMTCIVYSFRQLPISLDRLFARKTLQISLREDSILFNTWSTRFYAAGLTWPCKAHS